MGQFLIVSKLENLKEYKKISDKYSFGFEFNDFYLPSVLNDEGISDNIINEYKQNSLPEMITMHGAFLDVTIFSSDMEIRKISQKRMKQSMEIARKAGVSAVVFHTNINPYITNPEYVNEVIELTTNYLKILLTEYKDINIYLENMFDRSPEVIRNISNELKDFSNYGVCFDYAHASISPTPIEEWINEISQYVKHIHISDNNLKEDLHLPIGKGDIDWNKFKILYKKYFSECSVLIENILPQDQEQSIEYLINLQIL